MIAMDFKRDKTEIAQEFAQRGWLAHSGDAPDALERDCLAIWSAPGQTHACRRARVMAHLLRHAQVEVLPFEIFADQLRHNGISGRLNQAWAVACRPELADVLGPTEAASDCCAFTGEGDFGHTCPDWRSLFTLGYPGIIRRMEERRSVHEGPCEALDNSILVYHALLDYLGRLAEAARPLPRGAQIAENLHALRMGPPQTLYQALQMTFISYVAQQELETAPVRSLGRFDLLLAPFYERDLAEGRCTREEARELLKYYFWRWNAWNVIANIPITLCGRDAGGQSAASPFTALLLETYAELQIISPKFHIRCYPGMDMDIVRQALEMVRQGVNSIVFCNDEVVESALQKRGQTPADARDYIMVGCYEPTSMGREVACSCNGRISFPKAVEYALAGGVDLLTGKQVGSACAGDYASFDGLMEAVKEQLRFFADGSMARIVAIEQQYPKVFSTPFLTGTMENAVQAGVDAYLGGAKYNNSSINALSIATAVDALAAIRRLVYEEQQLTLPQLTELLRQDWAGAEPLRLTCLKRMPKYGVGDPAVDAIASELMDCVCRRINGAPNGRGGVFRTGAFSIDWRYEFGAHTGASADGRHAGDPLSKNLCASLGADTLGPTAMARSACAFDATALPNGTVLDIMLHPSAVAGASGLTAMQGLVMGFLHSGGIAIQCNVLDGSMLEDAQAHPERYSTLQVRLCGWNVLFVELSRKEQDELIRQAYGK